MRGSNAEPLVIRDMITKRPMTCPVIMPKENMTMTNKLIRIINNLVTMLQDHFPVGRANKRACGEVVTIQIGLMHKITPQAITSINIPTKLQFKRITHVNKGPDANASLLSGAGKMSPSHPVSARSCGRCTPKESSKIFFQSFQNTFGRVKNRHDVNRNRR